MADLLKWVAGVLTALVIAVIIGCITSYISRADERIDDNKQIATKAQDQSMQAITAVGQIQGDIKALNNTVADIKDSQKDTNAKLDKLLMQGVRK